MEWTGLDWNGGTECNVMEWWNDRGSSLNRIAGHINNILVILVQGRIHKMKFGPFYHSR